MVFVYSVRCILVVVVFGVCCVCHAVYFGLFLFISGEFSWCVYAYATHRESVMSTKLLAKCW